MLIILAEEDLPVLLSDVDMEELVNAKKIKCTYQYGGIAISLAKGVPEYLQYEITDKLITLGIDYELRV